MFSAWDEQHVGLYLLDVSSHGVPAALLAVMLSRVLSPVTSQSSLLKQRCDAPLVISWCPSRSSCGAQPAISMSRVMASTSSYCSAGFADACSSLRSGASLPYPSARQPTSEVLSGEGMPIGFLDEAGYQERCVTLRPGDRIFLYSDGITEGKDSSEQLWGKTG